MSRRNPHAIYISLFEAAARTGINRRQLRKAIGSGKLKGNLHLAGGEVDVASLRDFVRGLPVRPKGEDGERVSKITVPDKCHPLSRFIFLEMKRQAVTYDQLAARSGVLKTTFKAWRKNNMPGLDTVEPALAALGFRLEVVPVGEAERRVAGGSPTPPRPYGAAAAGRPE